MSIRTAPCDWPIDYAACGVTLSEVGTSPASSGMFEDAAVEYLWNWTGRRFGLCLETIRPCRSDCPEGVSTFFGSSGSWPGGAPWHPVLIGGAWSNLSCGRCGDVCGCGHISQIGLPGPVHSIDAITIDGATVPSGAYRVDDNKWLVRLDGDAWPTCQNFALPTTQAGTWAVTYRRGIEVPQGGQLAAGLLAAELAKFACNDTTCRLPKRVQTVTRQGVTIALLDSFDDIDKGHTGIWPIDSWVSSMMRAPQGGRVYSPDLPARGRRKTWPG